MYVDYVIFLLFRKKFHFLAEILGKGRLKPPSSLPIGTAPAFWFWRFVLWKMMFTNFFRLPEVQVITAIFRLFLRISKHLFKFKLLEEVGDGCDRFNIRNDHKLTNIPFFIRIIQFIRTYYIIWLYNMKCNFHGRLFSNLPRLKLPIE